MSTPTRLFIVESEDPCVEVRDLSLVLLNVFLVSRGIRIDTRLLISNTRTGDTILIDGYRLRHLYPQESSLLGFAKAIFCKNKELPGVEYNRGIEIYGSAAVLYPASHGYTIWGKPVELGYTYYIVLLDKRTRIIGAGSRETPRIPVKVPMGIPRHYIASIMNYVLDTWVGALVRRKGEVVRYGGYS